MSGPRAALVLGYVAGLALEASGRRLGTIEYNPHGNIIRGVRTTQFSDWISLEWWHETCVNLPGTEKRDDLLHKIWYDPENVNPAFPYLLSGVHIFRRPNCEGESAFQAIERSFEFDWGDDDDSEIEDEEDGEGEGEAGGDSDQDTAMTIETGHSEVGTNQVEGVSGTNSNRGNLDLFAQSPNPRTQPPSRDEHGLPEGFNIDNFFQQNNLIQLANSPGLQPGNFPSDFGSPVSQVGPTIIGRPLDIVYINNDDKDFNPGDDGVYQYIFWDPILGFEEEYDSPLSMRIEVDWHYRYNVN
ncbi:hypothetical protein TWF281_010177 [Arthrobotrys megalospora]